MSESQTLRQQALSLAKSRPCTIGHAYRILREKIPPDRPVGHPGAKLSPALPEAIRLLKADKIDDVEAARMIGKSVRTFYRHKARLSRQSATA